MLVKELDIPYYKEDLDSVVNYLNDLDYTAVKTKYNAKGNWDAISIKGYSEDIGNILKPGVLKHISDVEDPPLRWTYLYEQNEMSPVKEILSHIPAEFDRVRIMRLKAGTTIKKHTDKVDKEIKNGKLVRIHVPLKTSNDVHFYVWEGKEKYHFNLQAGKYYYIDVSKPHAVDNKANFDRLHLVVDCYNNEEITKLLT